MARPAASHLDAGVERLLQIFAMLECALSDKVTAARAWRPAAATNQSAEGDDSVKRIAILVVIGIGLYVARPKQMEELAEDAHEAITEGVEDFSGQTAMDLKDKAAEQLKKQNLSKALKEFEGLRGKKPEEIEELVQEGLLNKAEAVDEWGRSLKVEVTADGVVFRSAGKDGRFHTRDDWTLGES